MIEPGASLAVVDPQLAALIDEEGRRQGLTLSLVASENVVSNAVLEAQGSILTNKYADGYPGRREYDGCEVVDAIEDLACDRLRTLFGAEYANVQPYSGSNANAAILAAFCEPGDPVLGFDFSHGGHPTHYDSETFAGRYYRGYCYHVRESDRLVDLDEVRDLARAHHPRVIFAGWSCYQRYFDFAAFRSICDEVGAYLVVDMAHFAGLVAAGLHPDPVPYADACTMTTHKTLGGARGGAIIARGEFAKKIDDAVFPGEQGCPLVHVVAGKAVTFAYAATEAFAERMARTVAGARTLAAAFLNSEEVTHLLVVTGGTDVHQFLLDTGPSGQDAASHLARLHEIGCLGNAMRIAFDVFEAPLCSGLRLGATSLATRGFAQQEFEELGSILVESLTPGSSTQDLAPRIRELAISHPVD